jgi:hypothetical protein
MITRHLVFKHLFKFFFFFFFLHHFGNFALGVWAWSAWLWMLMSMRSETFGLCWSSVLLAFLAAPIAAANGFANMTDFQIAAHGVTMDTNGKIMPAIESESALMVSLVVDANVHAVRDLRVMLVFGVAGLLGGTNRAKEAVTNGFANMTDFQIAAHGVTMDTNGKIMPAIVRPSPRTDSRCSK